MTHGQSHVRARVKPARVMGRAGGRPQRRPSELLSRHKAGAGRRQSEFLEGVDRAGASHTHTTKGLWVHSQRAEGPGRARTLAVCSQARPGVTCALHSDTLLPLAKTPSREKSGKRPFGQLPRVRAFWVTSLRHGPSLQWLSGRD